VHVNRLSIEHPSSTGYTYMLVYNTNAA